ncbi:MAG TPA: hypothetical protein DCY94_00085, partial [Firmicutes bacterium]|nr:hypothetical protein [Bacillota bacterium]
MKNAIIFFYNIEPTELQEKKNAYSFYVDYEKYYLYKLMRPKSDIDAMLKIVNSHPKSFHKIIPNRIGEPTTKIENAYYILIKILGPEHSEIDIRDILLNEIPYDEASVLDRSNWGALWSEKVDYLEYQVSELAAPHPIIKKSFSYYVGLAENAITYYNLLNHEKLPLYISHRRIPDPPISLDFYNPLNLILDIRVRDIASYYKIQFFNEDFDRMLKEVDLLIEKDILSPLEYNLLFCRMLYPSYYFDLLSQILEKDEDEQSALKYIEKISQYEKFLNEIWHRFSKKSSMIKIDWLI